ncbi:MAG: polysaccharide biosynthesis protein [Clostridiales bacterium]|nr:polysaccharide biosynthesis protein [Clostridiales bacterium]
MGSININGTFTLFFANLAGKFFGAIFRFPLSNILGAEGMGLYQMAFPIYSFLLTLITGGVGILLTKQIALFRARGDQLAVYKEYKLGKNVSLFFGIICFAILMLLAFPIALLQGNTNATSGYFAIALGFVFASLLGAYRGYYQGHNNMFPTAISQILEQIFKLVFGLLFAGLFIKINTNLGVFGALLGISLSELFAFAYFAIINKKRVQKFNIKLEKKDYTMFIKRLAPISAAYMVLPLSMLVDSFLIINLLKGSGFVQGYATSLYGLHSGMILPIINLPNVLISAIALAGIPKISYKIAKGEDVRPLLSKGFKLVLLYILPCMAGIFLLARPIISSVFMSLSAQQLQIATTLLRLSVFEMFFLCFVTISNSVLQAMGKAKVSFVSLAIGVAVKTVLTILLVSNESLNIYGLTLASFVGYAIASIINLVKIRQIANFRLTFLQVFSPLFASTVMSAIIVLCMNIFSYINLLQLAIIISISMAVYFAIMFMLKQIRFSDVKNLLQKTSKF